MEFESYPFTFAWRYHNDKINTDLGCRIIVFCDTQI